MYAIEVTKATSVKKKNIIGTLSKDDDGGYDSKFPLVW